MTKPDTPDAVDAPVVTHISDEEAAAVTAWLLSDEGRQALLRAVEETNRAITRLDKVRVVKRRDLHRPITLSGVIGYT